MRLEGRVGLASGLAYLAATMVLVAACAHVAVTSSPSTSSAGATATPSFSAVVPSPSPTQPRTASPTIPRPTPPAPNEPWGGLVWLEPVPTDLPWGHIPASLLAWQGSFVGFDREGTDGTGEQIIASSSDLVHWDVLVHGESGPFGGTGPGWLVAGPSGLVAIGSHNTMAAGCSSDPASPICATDWQVWTSPDGSAWRREQGAPFAGSAVVDVAANEKGVLVLVSSGWQKPAIWYSADGSSWRSATLSSAAFADADVTGVWAYRGGFLATGGIGGRAPDGIGDPGGHPGGWWSVDGLTWTKASVDLFGQAMYLQEVHQVSNGLVAVGFRMGAWSSSDGHSWKKLPAGRLTDGTASFVSDGHHGLACYSSESSDDPLGNPGAADWSTDYWGTVDGRTWRQLAITDADNAASLDTSPYSRLVVLTDGLVAIAETPGESSGITVFRALATR